MFEYFPNNYPWSLAVMGALSRGGMIGEVDEACRPLKEFAARKNDPAAQLAWFESWMKLAERVERLGAVDEQAKHPLSAGRKYLRAGLYFLMAERMPSHKDPRRMIAYKRGIEVYAKGLKLRKEPVERVEIPYGEHKLPAFFMKAPGEGRAPCMVHFDGFDVTKEIIYTGAAEEYRRRGISLLIVDHPGVGEALRLLKLPSIPETEKPAKAAVDYLETRSDVDPERIGMVALSLGGYYAPRAAAYEKRFKCCVAWGAIYDFGIAFEARISGTNEPSVPGFAEHAQWVFGKNTLEEAKAVTRQMTLEKAAAEITCPLLIVHGENDRQIPLWHAEKTYEAAVNSPDRELKIFHLADGGAEHCGADNGSLIVDYITDWAAEKLNAKVAGL
ncbi:MAG TPA: prolyl oligopeptidase family serine peptidase [Xanthobacteraceae bacterium]|nr:prolyl oligopeptidase family serine peptidase [Xanthobacteraceae bacterium]